MMLSYQIDIAMLNYQIDDNARPPTNLLIQVERFK